MLSRRIVLLLGAIAICALAIGVTVAPGKTAPDRKAVFATMNGKKEVSPEGTKGVGDKNGFGSFTAIVAGDKLCYGMTVRAVDQPVAAHIHKGSPSVAGPIVIPLKAPSSGDGGAIGDCVTVAKATLRAVFKNPSKYYVNVHTMAFPGGAVRGQLSNR
jgi:CHRD domain